MKFSEPKWTGITPRKWQAEATAIALKNLQLENPESGVIHAIPGAGKSVVISEICECARPDKDEVIVVSTSSIFLVEQIRETITERLGEEFMGPPLVGSYYTSSKDINTPIIVTCMPSMPDLSNALQAIGKKCALWIADECVVAGTMLSTPFGRREIDETQIGDYVLGFDHLKRRIVRTKVLNTFKRKTHSEILNVRGIMMTGEHPVYTNRGYIKASEISEYDKTYSIFGECEYGVNHLRMVQDNLPNRQTISEREKWSKKTILRKVMPSKICELSFMGRRSEIEASHENEGAYVRSKYAEKSIGIPEFGSESIQTKRDKYKSPYNLEEKWIQDAEWRKRNWTNRATEDSRTTPELAYGGVYSDKEQLFGISHMLQIGYSQCRFENWSRGRRKLTPYAINYRKRQKEAVISGVFGLDDNSLQKRRGDGRFGRMYGNYSGETEVYNIETETGNYFANGLLVHNCHRTESNTILTAHNTLQPEITIGFSATPFRANEKHRLTLFDKLWYSYGAKDALADGVVVPWRIVPWTGGETELNTACIMMTENAEGSGLFNARDINDATLFCQLLESKNFKALPIHSKMPRSEIKKRIAALKNGELRALVHVSMLQEGADFPWLRWLCMRRPVSSRVRFIQELGRTLRAYEGKKEAVIYDPLGLFDSFNMSYEAVLGGEYEIEETGKTLAEQKEEMFGQMIFDMMKAVVDAQAMGEPINLTPLASYLRELVTAFDAFELIQRKIVNKQWRADASSEKQKSALGKMVWITQRGCVPKNHRMALKMLCESARNELTKGMSSDLLSVLFSLSDKKTWPDFKRLDASVDEATKKVIYA